MRISIELFLLDNWLMNCATLCCSAALSGLGFRKTLAPAFCLLGAVYALLALQIGQWLLSLPVRIAFGLVLALGLRCNSWKSYARAVSCVLLSAFLLGGLLLLLTQQRGMQGAYGMVNGIVVGTVGMRAVLCCVAVAAMLPRLFRYLRTAARIERSLLRMRVSLAGRRFDVLAMLDTGNLLTEPITGLPIVLLADCPNTGQGYPVQFCGMGGAGEILCTHATNAEVWVNGEWRETDVMVARAPYAIRGAQAIIGTAALPPEAHARRKEQKEDTIGA